MPNEIALRVQAHALTDFCVHVFQRLDVSEPDAHITADVLVTADLRGIFSHGVGHLRRYAEGLRSGMIVAHPQEQVVTETPATATIDAGAGLGSPISYRAMQKAIQKALEVGAGFVTVRHSNHYGIAGYYAMMALEHDCIGLAMTNASPVVMPTFARRPMLGTNPIAVAAPAGQERPFVLDMATSTVALGKVEVADRLNKPIPLGWVVDENGVPMDDAHLTFEKIRKRGGAGLLPLGGAGETLGGYKGYGLALWVDILCGVLSGAAYSNLISPRTAEGKPHQANVGHFFGAWRLDAFRPADEFKAAMDDLQQRLKNTPKAEGQDRIYIPGEKEYEATERYRREGIPLDHKVVADLKTIAQELDVEYNLE
jgi:L-2-hydroxycarboxylate dehydrogenase (NAD+)